MTRRIDSTQALVLTLILTAVAALAAAVGSRAPGLAALAAMTGVAAAAIVVLPSRWEKLTAVYLTSILVAVSVSEAWLWRSDLRANPPGLRVVSSHKHDVVHPVLGFAPYPSNVRHVVRMVGERVIYDVDYTIDDRGLRVSPPARPDADRHAVFFGGSFTYGAGVEDNETLPWRVGELTDGYWHVYNLGFSGYGPQQMLAALQSGMVGDLVGRGGEVLGVYQCTAYHAKRAAGTVPWEAGTPRYRVSPGGGVERDGVYPPIGPPSTVDRLIGWSFLARRLVGDLRGPRRAEIDLLAAVVAAAGQEMADRFGGRLEVLYWDEGPGWRDARVLAALTRRGVSVHRVSVAVPTRSLEYRLHEADRHPNAEAYRLLAEWVSHDLLRSPEGCGLSR